MKRVTRLLAPIHQYIYYTILSLGITQQVQMAELSPAGGGEGEDISGPVICTTIAVV